MDKWRIGIHVGHNASCAFMRGGEIVYASQEERFRRFKYISGFPQSAMAYGFEKFGLRPEEVAAVGFSSTRLDPVMSKSNYVMNFSIRDFHGYFGDRYWRRRMAGDDCLDYWQWLRDDAQFNNIDLDFDYAFIDDQLLGDRPRRMEVYREHLVAHLAKRFAIDPKVVRFLDHHTCHAHYGYFGSPFREDDCAVVVLDGLGDGNNETVWQAQDDAMTCLASSGENDIGHVYKMATLLLGMRPEVHEYKVMGMAPYAKDSHVEAAYAPLRELYRIEDMRIVAKERPRDLFGYLQEAWVDQRFDNISGAVQRFAEEVSAALFEDIHRRLGVRRFALSGGIAMNIKMNKALSEMDFVDEIFVCGSGSDESLSIGACYALNPEPKSNQPLPDLYLGFDIADDLADGAWRPLCRDFEVREEVDEAEIVGMLVEGDIVASVQGRAEFGARALGNRSILADPSRLDAVYRINEAIKNRDFWMPFALSVLEEEQDYCMFNPKGLSAPFMSIGFDSRPENYDRFRAGTHPYDRTVRPQLVDRERAPGYHRLISAFKSSTGVPALLNTSFNLHGEPIVNNAADSIATFANSGLDHLYLGRTLISKRQRDRDGAEPVRDDRPAA
jgi:carbamoyltransferase